MELRPFGKTGIQISAVGFGCWEIGGGYGSIEESEFIKAVNRALDLGINCFDTAEAYGFGASEKSLTGQIWPKIFSTKFFRRVFPQSLQPGGQFLQNDFLNRFNGNYIVDSPQQPEGLQRK